MCIWFLCQINLKHAQHFQWNHATADLCFLKSTAVSSVFQSRISFNQTVFLCVLPTEEELRKLREETNVETLKQELEKEKSKRVDLEQKMNEILRSRYERWFSSTVKFPTTTFGYIMFSFSCLCIYLLLILQVKQYVCLVQTRRFTTSTSKTTSHFCQWNR